MGTPSYCFYKQENKKKITNAYFQIHPDPDIKLKHLYLLMLEFKYDSRKKQGLKLVL